MTHTTEQLEAMVAAANARADQAWDAALVEAAGTLEVQALDTDAQAKRFRGGSDPWADRTARSRALRNSAAAILALRDKPAPAVTVQDFLLTHRRALIAAATKARHSHACDGQYGIVGSPCGEAAYEAILAEVRTIAGGGDE